MKYLVLFAVLFIAYMMWRNKRIEDDDTASRRGGAAAKPLEMVSCELCGLHLPRPDAVAASNGRFFCSDEHRQRAARR